MPNCKSLFKQKYCSCCKWVDAISGLKDIPPGTRLKVLKEFKTDDKCPFGEGHICFLLEKNYIIVDATTNPMWLHIHNISEST